MADEREKVSLDAFAEAVGGNVSGRETVSVPAAAAAAAGEVYELGLLARTQLRIGAGVAVGMLLLLLVVLGLITLYAFETFPTPESVKERLPKTGSWLEEYDKARSAWFQEIKDLLQLLVVSLLVPALTTVLGYIFGRQETAAQQATSQPAGS